jgi:hypothetical protein
VDRARLLGPEDRVPRPLCRVDGGASADPSPSQVALGRSETSNWQLIGPQWRDDDEGGGEKDDQGVGYPPAGTADRRRHAPRQLDSLRLRGRVLRTCPAEPVERHRRGCSLRLARSSALEVRHRPDGLRPPFRPLAISRGRGGRCMSWMGAPGHSVAGRRAPSSSKISVQSRTHRSQMKSPGPATSLGRSALSGGSARVGLPTSSQKAHRGGSGNWRPSGMGKNSGRFTLQLCRGLTRACGVGRRCRSGYTGGAPPPARPSGVPARTSGSGGVQRRVPRPDHPSPFGGCEVGGLTGLGVSARTSGSGGVRRGSPSPARLRKALTSFGDWSRTNRRWADSGSVMAAP